MSAGWEVGDLALCVDTDPAHRVFGTGVAGKRFKLGAVYCVAHVGTHPVTDELVLLMEGQSKTAGAFRFRKIRPDEHQACEEEFRILIMLSKKRVSA